MSIVQALSKLMGWPLLAVNSHVGVGEMEPVGNVQSIMLASPMANRSVDHIILTLSTLAIRCTEIHKLRVSSSPSG